MTFFQKLTEYVKYIYIIHIVCAFCSWTTDTMITKVTPLLVVGMSALILVHRLTKIKKYISYPFIWIYVAFVSSYLLSTIFNWKYGFMTNVKIMIWMTIQIGILYLFDLSRNKEMVDRELKNSMKLIVGLTSVMNLIGLGMLFMNHCSFRILEDGRSFLIGISYWGRLYGIHTDPNYGAVQTVIAIMCLAYLWFLANDKKQKIIYGCLGFMNFVHLAFSGSRTGLVALLVSGIVFAFIWTYQKERKIMKAVISATVYAMALLVLNTSVISGYNSVVRFVGQIVSVDDKEDPDGEGNEDELTQIGREELSGDVSNRRFDLWKNALQVAGTAPIVGITFGNIVSYCEQNLPNSYLLTNDYTVFNAFHNMFMDLLVSQGILGTAIFVGLMIVSLVFLFVNREHIKEEDQMKCCLLFSISVGMICSSLFVSEILYVHNQITVLFWLLWGYLIFYFVYNIRGRKNEKSRDINRTSR